MSKLDNYYESINTLASEQPEQFILASEARYRNIICRVAEQAVSSGAASIILLAGPSASGKTTTAGKIAQALVESGHAAYTVSLDNFYLNQELSPRLPDGTPDFETVHALDIPLIHDTFCRLMRDGRCELPLFDFTTGQRSAQTEQLFLEKGDVVIVEGLHALNPLIYEAFPPENLLKVYVSVSSRIYTEKGKIVLNKRNLRFVRRLIRDSRFRATDVYKTFTLWQSVQRGEDLYLFPYRGNADVRINSIHLYEPCVFREEAVHMLHRVEPEHPFYRDAVRMIASLERFVAISREFVPEESLLREFLGKE